MISSGTRGCELVCWWLMTHSEGEFWVHFQPGPPLTCLPDLSADSLGSRAPQADWCCVLPPEQLSPELLCPRPRGDGRGAPPGLSTEGLIQGEQQCLWLLSLLLMAGRLSRETVRVRGSRFTSILSVWIAEKILGKHIAQHLKLTWCCWLEDYEVKNVPLSLQVGFPGGSVVENPAAQSRSLGFNPWVGRIPWRRKRQATLVLAWEIPQTEEPGGLQSMGLQKSQTRLSD